MPSRSRSDINQLASQLGGMKIDLQYIKHPTAKDRLAVLPEAQLLALQRMAVATLADIEGRHAFSDLPAHVQAKIARGENPIRVLREWRGLNGQQLAGIVGITPSMLSQIERHGKTGSVKTFRAIASALGVPLDAVFPRDPADETH